MDHHTCPCYCTHVSPPPCSFPCEQRKDKYSHCAWLLSILLSGHPPFTAFPPFLQRVHLPKAHAHSCIRNAFPKTKALLKPMRAPGNYQEKQCNYHGTMPSSISGFPPNRQGMSLSPPHPNKMLKVTDDHSVQGQVALVPFLSYWFVFTSFISLSLSIKRRNECIWIRTNSRNPAEGNAKDRSEY